MSTVTDQTTLKPEEPGVIESITQGISSVIQGKPEEEDKKEEESVEESLASVEGETVPTPEDISPEDISPVEESTEDVSTPVEEGFVPTEDNSFGVGPVIGDVPALGPVEEKPKKKRKTTKKCKCIKTKKNQKPTKRPRCKKGSQRNKKTKKCKSKKHCPKGSRRNPTTGECNPK
jgi:hypothetical protein